LLNVPEMPKLLGYVEIGLGPLRGHTRRERKSSFASFDVESGANAGTWRREGSGEASAGAGAIS